MSPTNIDDLVPKMSTMKSQDPIQVRLPLMTEIFYKVHTAKTKSQKIKILQDNDCEPLRQICKWSFDPNIETDLPEGNPPYIENEAPEGTEHTLIRTEANKFFYYIKNANTLQATEREHMFVRLLEGLHKDEAKLMLLVKDKILHQIYKGFSTAVVKEAFGWDDNFRRKDV